MYSLTRSLRAVFAELRREGEERPLFLSRKLQRHRAGVAQRGVGVHDGSRQQAADSCQLSAIGAALSFFSFLFLLFSFYCS